MPLQRLTSNCVPLYWELRSQSWSSKSSTWNHSPLPTIQIAGLFSDITATKPGGSMFTSAIGYRELEDPPFQTSALHTVTSEPCWSCHPICWCPKPLWSTWHTGPTFLHNKYMAAYMPVSSLASETKQDDPEAGPEINVLTTQLEPNKCLGSATFSRFSQWSTLLKAIIILARSRKKHAPGEKGDHAAPGTVLTAQIFRQAQSVIIKNVQSEAYGEDLRLLQNSERLPATSPLKKTQPIHWGWGTLKSWWSPWTSRSEVRRTSLFNPAELTSCNNSHSPVLSCQSPVSRLSHHPRCY